MKEPTITFGGLELLVHELRMLFESFDVVGEVLRCQVFGFCRVLLSQLELSAIF